MNDEINAFDLITTYMIFMVKDFIPSDRAEIRKQVKEIALKEGENVRESIIDEATDRIYLIFN